VDELFEDFLVFAHIVYEAAPTIAADTCLTYKAFAKLSDIEKIELMMSEVSSIFRLKRSSNSILDVSYKIQF
jgi:hypothetical protein